MSSLQKSVYVLMLTYGEKEWFQFFFYMRLLRGYFFFTSNCQKLNYGQLWSPERGTLYPGMGDPVSQMEVTRHVVQAFLPKQNIYVF